MLKKSKNRSEKETSVIAGKTQQEVTSGKQEEPAIVIPRSIYQVVLEHRTALRAFVFSLANFKMLGNDISSIELLSAKKAELGKQEEQFKRGLKTDALKHNPALEKLNNAATNALNSFSIFTKGYIDKLQDLHRGYNLSIHDKNEYWMGNIMPVYREYMLKKLSHINEVYDELNKIDSFIERLKVDFQR